MGIFNRTAAEDYAKEIKDFKMEQLRSHYSDKELTIVGLNDCKGFNTSPLLKKKLLVYLAQLLGDESTSVTIVNAFSQIFNKTEHLEYFLEGNLSVRDIKDLQVEETVSCLEKMFENFHVPKFIGKVGYVSKVLNYKRKEDSDILLADSIRSASEPIIVYSCGANDLMYGGLNDPIGFRRSCKSKDKKEIYKYTLMKFRDSDTVKKVIGNVEKNFDKIFSLNNNSEIFTLGLFIPRYLQNEEMQVICSTIVEYNGRLENLCKKHGVQYIDTENVFNFSKDANYDLAQLISENIFLRKFGAENTLTRSNGKSGLKVYNHGLMDVLINLKHDLVGLKKASELDFGCEGEVYESKIEEVERQKRVLEKVISRRM